MTLNFVNLGAKRPSKQPLGTGGNKHGPPRTQHKITEVWNGFVRAVLSKRLVCREVFVRFKLISSIIASASLVATPVLAQSASPASKLSIAQSRAGASVDGERLGEGSGGLIAAVLVAGIIAIGVLAAVESGDNDDDPVSA